MYVMPKCAKSLQKQKGDGVLYVKKKKAFILIKFANSISLHVQRIGITEEPRAQLELGFYSSKGGGEGFLRFRTSDWLTFA